MIGRKGKGEGDWGERIPLPFYLSRFSPSSSPLFVPTRQATVRALPAGNICVSSAWIYLEALSEQFLNLPFFSKKAEKRES